MSQSVHVWSWQLIYSMTYFLHNYMDLSRMSDNLAQIQRFEIQKTLLIPKRPFFDSKLSDLDFVFRQLDKK